MLLVVTIIVALVSWFKTRLWVAVTVCIYKIELGLYL